MEDQGATGNYIPHALARSMKLPSKSLSLMLRVLEDGQMIKETRMYSLNLTDRLGKKDNMQTVFFCTFYYVFCKLAHSCNYLRLLENAATQVSGGIREQ